jgi:hypothetical protein
MIRAIISAALLIAVSGGGVSADQNVERGGVPSMIRYFEEVVPVVSGATRGCVPGISIDERLAVEEAEAASKGLCDVPLDQFHLTFTALGKPFDVLVFGRAPTGEPQGPECFAPGQVPEAAEDRRFFERHDGLTCRRTAATPTFYSARAGAAYVKGGGSLSLVDGEWSGSIEVDGELYVLRPRSLYDSHAPLGTVIIYRYSDSDDF